MLRKLNYKIVLSIFAIVFIVLASWGLMILKNRNNDSISSSISNINLDSSLPSTEDTQNKSGGEEGATSQSETSPENPNTTAQNPSTPELKITGKMMANITPQHCDDECKAFAIDLSLFEYCQQVCGISPVKKVTNCDDKKDIRKDYCLKDLAINKKDALLCDKIEDDNIKKTCSNIIEETVLREMRQQTSSQRENPPF